MKPFFLLLTSFIFIHGFAQNIFWQKTTKIEASRTGIIPRTTIPGKQDFYRLDLDNFKAALATTPLRNSGQVSTVVLPFPDSEGKIQYYRIYAAPVLDAQLALKYPGNASYIGQGIDKRSSTIRFSITTFGLHAITLGANEGTYYIDPYSADRNYYTVYARKSLKNPGTFECHTSDNMLRQMGNPMPSQVLDNGIFRTYRMALACTVEYATFHIEAAGATLGTLEEKKAVVLAAMNVSMTRINAMYERDLSVSMVLVPTNDQIIFVEEDDELTNDDPGELINEGQVVIDSIIGHDNYDIGHTVSTQGGGLAGGSPCSDAKAFGVTGVGAPVGDPFDIDYVSHEIGHQFGAAHTYNNECGGNRDNNWSYEPGSGSTIMAYAGICEPNVQSNSDAQFFAGSIAQIRNRINGEANCAAQTSNNNTAPISNAGPDYVIPKGTAFFLEGIAVDAQNDAMTYSWEQYDKEISVQPPVPTATEGPNFRSQLISDSPLRWLPELPEVVNNNLAPIWEVISTVGREYNFAFTVRDNNINGGESSTDFMKVTAAETSGPFLVTSPNTVLTWVAATNHNITWNVAGTTANGVNTPNVDILLSTDGGQSFSTMIAQGVPNDGSESILIPNTPGLMNRIMVRGHNNIFYDISNKNFAIAPAGSTFIVEPNGLQNVNACQGTQVSYAVDYSHLNGFMGTTVFSISGNPEGSTAVFSPSTVSADQVVNLLISNTDSSPLGFYDMTITAVSGAVTKTIHVYLQLLSPLFSIPTLSFPENMAITVPTTTNLEWSPDANATQYNVIVASDPAMDIVVATASVNTNNYVLGGLEEGTTYYWSIVASNAGCSGTFATPFVFTTGRTSCMAYESGNVAVIIPDDQSITISDTINVEDTFVLSNVSVSLDIAHDWVGDLIVTLISPAGTPIQLFGQECWDADDVLATFDDNGNPLSCGSPIGIAGTFRPDDSLGTLNGEQATGDWVLQVFDEFGDDGGTLNSWSLNLCTFVTALSVADHHLDSLALYPNPNPGSFTVQLNEAFSLEYDLSVYDMRGRKIFKNKSQAHGGILLETIHLDAAAGIYLLEVQSEGQKIIKKFIVQ